MNKKRFKKIYLEITNACNLSCTFCIKNKRHIKYLSLDEFRLITDKLEPYTDYLYFHILGEPLMHPNICEFIDLASKKFNVQITTNGYLIDRLKDNSNIRRLNISLHSFDSKYQVSLEKYMNNIFEVVDNLIKKNTYISLRLWVENKNQNNMVKMINKHYNCNIDLTKNSFKINKYLYVNKFHEFIWPDLENNYYEEEGSCYGLIDHIGILVDGTIIPCCLDTKGAINLGNIYNTDLETVLNSERVKVMLEGFKQNKKREELCKHCRFIKKKILTSNFGG